MGGVPDRCDPQVRPPPAGRGPRHRRRRSLPVAAPGLPCPAARSARCRFPCRHRVAVKESHDHPHRPDRRPSHPGRRARRPARGRAARADLAAQEAAAEVLLRRPRQRAVRGDHGAARVLPDAHRGGAAHRPRRRDRGPDRGDDAGRARIRVVGQDTAPARRPHPGGHAAPLRTARRQRGRAARGSRRAGGAVPGAGPARGGRRLHRPPGPPAPRHRCGER